MGRPERPLDPSAGPVARFAHDLRQLRQGGSRPLPPDRLEARLLQRLLPPLGGQPSDRYDPVAHAAGSFVIPRRDRRGRRSLGPSA